MQLSLMLFMPVVGAIIAWFLPDNHRRPLVLPFFAVIHLALLSWVLVDTPPASAGAVLAKAPGTLPVVKEMNAVAVPSA